MPGRAGPPALVKKRRAISSESRIKAAIDAQQFGRVDLLGGRGAQLGLEAERDAQGRARLAQRAALGQFRQMAGDRVDLEGDRARIVGIEGREIDDRHPRRRHHIARAVGDLAVGEFEEKIEAARRRPRQTELAHEAGGGECPFRRRPSSRKRQPASRFMFSWARPEKAASDFQRRVGPLEGVALAEASAGGTRREQRLEIGERAPSIRRQALADHRSGVARGGDEGRDRAVRSAPFEGTEGDEGRLTDRADGAAPQTSRSASAADCGGVGRRIAEPRNDAAHEPQGRLARSR